MDEASGLNQLRATEYPERLLIPNGAKDFLVPVKTIVWIEAADYYARIHVAGKAYMLRETIKELASLLDPTCFLRIHRSTIVNLRFVQENDTRRSV